MKGLFVLLLISAVSSTFVSAVPLVAVDEKVHKSPLFAAEIPTTVQSEQNLLVAEVVKEPVPEVAVSWTTIQDKALQCTAEEYKGSLGNPTNWNNCLVLAQAKPGINYAVWRGDGDKACHTCLINSDRGPRDKWVYETIKGATSFVADGTVPVPPPPAGNPTHYGPTPSDGGKCKSDELALHITGDNFRIDGRNVVGHNPYFCTKYCSKDQDCPKDKPHGTEGRTYCSGAFTKKACVLDCKDSSDCDVGGLCYENPKNTKAGKWCAWDPPNDCYNINTITGYWDHIASAPGPQKLTYSWGLTQSSTVTNTQAWGTKVATKASGSFGVKDVLGGGLEVSGEISNTVTQSYAETFTMSKTEAYEANVPAGIVWQWKFNISDPCSNSFASRHDIMVSANQLLTPCCLPGYHSDIANVSSACVAGPRLCNR